MALFHRHQPHRPSSSPQRGSRAPLDALTRCGSEGTLHVERHPDHLECVDLPRHSHRSGNPEPFRCASADMATKIRQVGAQASPAPAYRVFQPALNLPDPPSFSPQWESRALSMRRHGHGNEDTTGWRTVVPRSGVQNLSAGIKSPRPPVILTAVGIQSPFDAPTRTWQRGYDRLADSRPPLRRTESFSRH